MAYPYNRNDRYQNNKKRNNQPQATLDCNFYNPYAFVPINNQVYLLNDTEKQELEQVHDIPFQNGFSGKIKVDFEAITPLCVKNAVQDNANIDGQYYIPGTSIKGMIRSVFEIITKSNLRNGIANARYSMRDLRNNDYELKSTNKPQKSGFLIQLNGNFFIVECFSTPYKYEDIERDEEIYGLKNCRTIAEKYRKLSSHIVEYKDERGTYFCMWFFSGFMNNKEHEFLFDIPSLTKGTKFIPLEDAEYQDFRFVHEIENENEAWKFWKKKLKNYSSIEEIIDDGYKGIVPCFYRTQTKAGHLCVKDLGFAFLYRQPYPHKMHDFLPESHIESGIDFAQSIFGYVQGNSALRGRVQFGNAFIQTPQFASPQTFILGSPKPTFYPFYIEQNTTKLATFFSSTARLSGYKRYLVHPEAMQGNIAPSKVTATFKPLSAGTKFTTIITFQNLRDYELGALLAAISFCQKQDTCFHSLGFAKPFGYGKLKVRNLQLETDNHIANNDSLHDAFIARMCEKLNYANKEVFLQSLSSLFLIAGGGYQDKPIRYPDMKKKEFNSIKNQKKSIAHFSPQKK